MLPLYSHNIFIPLYKLPPYCCLCHHFLISLPLIYIPTHTLGQGIVLIFLFSDI